MQTKFFFLKSPCEKIVYLLDQYAKGEVSGEMARRIEHHLGDCGGCRKELQVVDQVLALVDSLEREGPGRDLWPHIRQALNQAGPAGGRNTFRPAAIMGSGYSRWLGTLAAGGAVAAALGLGVFWPHPQAADTERLEPTPPRAEMVETEPVSYASQAERASLFDPLSDRASIGAVVENVGRRNGPYQFQINNALTMKTPEGGL